jgi:shikimate dehydrogenase
VEAQSRGAKAVSGLGMLVHQGALSFEMWTGREAPIQVMEAAVRKILNSEF